MTRERDDAPVKAHARHWGVRKFAGILLAGIGLFWLSKKSGWMPVEHGHSAIFWPVVVVGAGLFMFLGSRHKRIS